MCESSDTQGILLSDFIGPLLYMSLITLLCSCWFSWLGESDFHFELKMISNKRKKRKAVQDGLSSVGKMSLPASNHQNWLLLRQSASALPIELRILIHNTRCNFLCLKEFVRMACVIQRSDRGIDGFKLSLMTNQSNNLQRIVLIN